MSHSITTDPVTGGPVVDVLGHRMVLHDFARDRYVSPVLARSGYYEPFQTELVVNEVRPGDTALDLGAHTGFYTLLLARLVGRVKRCRSSRTRTTSRSSSGTWS